MGKIAGALAATEQEETPLLLEVPFLANAFGFMTLTLKDYLISMGLAFLVIPIVEIVKLVQRMTAKK